MRILVLGGTAFLGRAVTRQLVTDGHEVTCFARGNGAVPAGARLAVGDRDLPGAYEALAEASWDCVIDVTRQPGHAKQAVAALPAQHWILVSSASVYAAFDSLEQAESSATCPPLDGDVMHDMSTYGPAKVACEIAVREKSTSHTIIRAGLIGGYADTTARSGYYPWRFANPTGPDVLVPPDLTFPTALIDVEDLATWILHCALTRLCGTYNATGPTLQLAEFFDAARAAAQSDLPVTPIPAVIIQQAGIAEWMGPSSLPLWLKDPSWRFFSTLDTTRARSEGLQTRPLVETLRDALRYEQERTTPRPAGLTNDDESRIRTMMG